MSQSMSYRIFKLFQVVIKNYKFCQIFGQTKSEPCWDVNLLASAEELMHAVLGLFDKLVKCINFQWIAAE